MKNLFKIGGLALLSLTTTTPGLCFANDMPNQVYTELNNQQVRFEKSISDVINHLLTVQEHQSTLCAEQIKIQANVYQAKIDTLQKELDLVKDELKQALEYVADSERRINHFMEAFRI